MKELIVIGTLLFAAMIVYIIILHLALRDSNRDFNVIADCFERSRANSNIIEEILQEKIKRLEREKAGQKPH
jgi:hypothetical protein